MKRLLLTTSILVLFCLLSINLTAQQSFDTKAGLQNFIENFVLSQLPGPVGDAVVIVKESPAIYKTSMLAWLSAKMVDASAANDWKSVRRYQAFHTCMATGDCRELDKVQREIQINSRTNKDVSGTWDWICCNGRYSGQLTLETSPNGNLTGYFSSHGSIYGRINGNTLNFKRIIGNSEQIYTLQLSSDQNTLNGSFKGFKYATVGTEFRATRKK